MALAPNTAPKLSIVIAAWNGEAMLRECLQSLKGQGETADIEIIVAANFGGEIRLACELEFGNLTFLAQPAETSVPQLRSAGIAAARGEIVALAEDHCIFDAEWCAEIKKAHLLDHSVVGGSVENSEGQRALDWAVYFYDYGRYMPPNSAGEVASLSGNNVSYKRAALEDVRDLFREGFFETFVHQELARRGHRLYLAPSAIVYHRKRYEFGAALVQCFHLARSFAARRTSRAPVWTRFGYALGSLLLPVLLPARISATVLRKKRRLGELFRAFPFVLVLMANWSFGEFCGYLFGEGASAGKWK